MSDSISWKNEDGEWIGPFEVPDGEFEGLAIDMAVHDATAWMTPKQVEAIKAASVDLATFYNRPFETVINQLVSGIERDLEIQRIIREEIHKALERFNVNLTE